MDVEYKLHWCNKLQASSLVDNACKQHVKCTLTKLRQVSDGSDTTTSLVYSPLLLEENNRWLDSAKNTFPDNVRPNTDRGDFCVIKQVPCVRHEDESHVVLTIVAYHATDAVYMLVWLHFCVQICNVPFLQTSRQMLQQQIVSSFTARAIAASLCSLRSTNEHASRNACMAAVISNLDAFAVCHASCMVNTSGGSSYSTCCTTFCAPQPPATRADSDNEDDGYFHLARFAAAAATASGHSISSIFKRPKLEQHDQACLEHCRRSRGVVQGRHVRCMSRLSHHHTTCVFHFPGRAAACQEGGWVVCSPQPQCQ